MRNYRPPLRQNRNTIRIQEYHCQAAETTTYQVEDDLGAVLAIAKRDPSTPDAWIILDPTLDPSLDEDIREWLEDDDIDMQDTVKLLQAAGYNARRGWPTEYCFECGAPIDDDHPDCWALPL